MLNSSRIKVSHKLLVRGICSSSCLFKANPEWVALQRRIKAKQDEEWNKREHADRFKTNVGVRHQMKALGFRDISDPTLTKRLDFRDLGYEEELTDQLEETMEHTNKFQDDLVGYKRR